LRRKTLQTALQSLGLDPADNVNTANFTGAGQTPASLLSHTIKREYVILGVTQLKLQTTVAFVSTYKADEASYKIEAEPTKITLSVKLVSYYRP